MIYGFYIFQGTINSSISVFKYHEGKSSDEYQDKEFVPIFIEDFDKNEVEKAKNVCGGKTSSAACVYDFLLTKDESIGKDSGRVNIEAIETVKTSGYYQTILVIYLIIIIVRFSGSYKK